MQGIEKKRKYYALQEVVWIKEDKTTGVVKAIDTKNLTVTVKVTKVDHKDLGDGMSSGGVMSYEKTIPLWCITKYRTPKLFKTLTFKQKPLTIPVKYLTELDDQFKELVEIEIGDWIDLRCAETVSLKAFDSTKIKLGLAMQLPKGYEAHIAPRGSTFKNYGILQTNTPGIVDNSYSGDSDEWLMSVYATRNTTIIRGERVCQFRIVQKMPKATFVKVDTLGNPDRSGFGSTGTK